LRDHVERQPDENDHKKRAPDCLVVKCESIDDPHRVVDYDGEQEQAIGNSVSQKPTCVDAFFLIPRAKIGADTDYVRNKQDAGYGLYSA